MIYYIFSGVCECESAFFLDADSGLCKKKTCNEPLNGGCTQGLENCVFNDNKLEVECVPAGTTCADDGACAGRCFYDEK